MMKTNSGASAAALSGLALVLLLGACATATDAPASAAALPAAYIESDPAGHAAPATDWWRGFGSAELSALIDAALAANPDFQMAAERVRQAQAQAAIANASLFPALAFGAGASRRETRGGDGGDAGSSSFNAALNANYEVDLWGQNRSAARSAEFALRATRFDRETVRLSVVSGVASGYFQLLAVRERLRLAQENLTIAARVFKVVQVRADNGAVSSLDVARQLIDAGGVGFIQLGYALAILIDRAPQDFSVGGMPLMALGVPDVGAGLPSQLLLRRPDLASMEAQLAAANANVAVARAALLPSIALTGSAGAASATLGELVNAPALTLALGASLLQPIFDGGRLRAQVDVAASQERGLVLSYRKVILAALAEVESALAARSRYGQQEVLLTQAQQQAAQILRLAQVRYREGSDDLLVLLDAQRTLFQADDQLAQIRLSRLQATLDLIKALGGGWQSD